MFSLDAVVSAVLYLIIAGIVFYLLHWLIGYVGVPEPFGRVARVVLAVAAVVVVIAILLNLVGRPLVRAAANRNQGPWMAVGRGPA